MRPAIAVSSVNAGLPFLDTRLFARQLREQVEEFLAQTREVELNFTGVNISQSFADELVGVLLLTHSPEVLDRLVFKGCSDSVKAVIEFVVADRYDEYVRTRSH
jgi:hypothetical protein